jgi:hypothetical protein
VLTIRRSKTDRDAAGTTVAVPPGTEDVPPCGRLRRWLEVAPIYEGVSFAGSIVTEIWGSRSRIERWVRSWRRGRLPLDSKVTSLGIRCAPGSRPPLRAPAAPKPRSCVMGAGRVCRSPGATSARGARWDDNPAANLGL